MRGLRAAAIQLGDQLRERSPAIPARNPSNVATGEYRLTVASVLSPVTPDKNGSPSDLGESETNDGAILHNPVEVVTGTVTWRPERAETAFTVHIPLPV